MCSLLQGRMYTGMQHIEPTTEHPRASCSIWSFAGNSGSLPHRLNLHYAQGTTLQCPAPPFGQKSWLQLCTAYTSRWQKLASLWGTGQCLPSTWID